MSAVKPNTAFWIIAVLALLWNIIGVAIFLFTVLAFDLLAEGLPPDQLALYSQLPSWYYFVYGTATIAAFLACITMLMRRKLTVPLFLISLIAVLIAQGFWLFATDVIDVMGPGAMGMPLVVIAISIFLYFYSKGAKQKGWLV